MDLANLNAYLIQASNTPEKILLENMIEKIINEKEIKYAFFDFDNTIYPGILLFDLSIECFKDNQIKTKNLFRILSIFKKGNFLKASEEFGKLLKGTSTEKFYRPLNKLIKKIPKGAIKVINQLKKKGTKCYLISLTSEDIAKIVCEKFNLDGYIAFRYGKQSFKNKKVFDGTIKPKVANVNEFKKKSLKKFIKNKKKYKQGIAFGDSLDDELMLKSFEYKVVVGNKELAKKVNGIDISKSWQK